MGGRRRGPVRGWLSATSLLGLIALLAGCGSSTSSGHPSAAPLLVAVEAPITGSLSSLGADMINGAQLAATDINAAGGVLGRSIQIVPVDDAADAATGASAARAVLSRRIVAVVGPYNSAVGVKTLPIYQHAGLPILRLTSSTLTEGFGITTQPMANQVAPVESDQLVHVLHAKSVAILYDPSQYTSGVSTQLRRLLIAAGVAIPVFQSIAPVASPAAALAKVAAAHPGVLYLGMYGPQAGAVVAKWAPTAGGTRCFVDGLAGEGAEYLQAAGRVADKCLFSGVPTPDQLPSSAAYTSAYQARFHQAPETWGPFVYDSVRLLAVTIQRLGTTQPARVAAALEQVSGYAGVTGTISIESGSGNRHNPPLILLDVTAAGKYVVDRTWAAYAHYPVS